VKSGLLKGSVYHGMLMLLAEKQGSEAVQSLSFISEGKAIAPPSNTPNSG
jgi:hypothetical protein